MQIIWDENKNQINKAKHRISFETAQKVFSDPLQVSKQDRYENGEERWQTLGTICGVLVLLVAHTWKHENGEEIIRIISARKASSHERKCYEEGNN